MGNKKRLRPHTHRGMERRLRGNKKPRMKIVNGKKKEAKKITEEQ